jgi:predicted neuraminidase
MAGGVMVQSLAAEALVKSEFIYERAPFPECHASTIVETGRGLTVAWFGGKREKSPDVGIWLSHHWAEGGWTAPVEVANGIQHASKRYPCWNPVLFQPRQGPLMLFYKVGPDPDEWWGMLTVSTDDGLTWSEPRRLPEDVLGPVKNKPIQLANGEILCASSTEHAGWRVHFERTSDLGRTWGIIGPVNDGKAIGAIQPSILVHGAGRLQALGRTTKGKVFEVWSEDNGLTWRPMILTSLPNPNSGTDALTLKDSRHLLVYNHTPRGRSPLNVALSSDGKNWQAAWVLENEPGMEFSYPAVIQTRDGLVHVTYTWKRQRVKHAVLDPRQFTLKEIKDGRWPE